MKKFVISVITIVCIITSVAIPSFAATYKAIFYMDSSFNTKHGGSATAQAVALSEFRAVFNDAVKVFDLTWGVDIVGLTYADTTLSGSGTSWLYWTFPANILPLEACPIHYASECTTLQCGSYCVNDITASSNHHKNGFKNWLPYINYSNPHVITGAEDLVIMMTATGLCYNKNGAHSNSLGGLSGSDCILIHHSTTVNSYGSYTRRILQHELGHYFGLADGECNGTCVMSLGYYNDANWSKTDIWCESCRAKLDNYFN